MLWGRAQWLAPLSMLRIKGFFLRLQLSYMYELNFTRLTV